MTIREIAKLAGVSPAAVSLVLNNKPGVGAQRRSEIQALLRENGYEIKEQPETSAPKKQICCVKYRTNYDNDEFSISILDTIEEYANRSGYSVSVVNITHDTYAQKLSTLDYSTLKGIVFFASEISEECLNFAQRIPIPTVYVDIFSAYQTINTVNADQRQIANLAARHLINLGHQEIGYLKIAPERGYLGQRFRYFSAELKSSNISLPPECTFTFDAFADDLDEQMYTAFSQLNAFPTAFFAEGDLLAASCIHALTRLGYRVPEDISVIGVDNTRISQFTTPKLTSIDVNMREMGRVAVERLLRLIDEPERPVLHIYITPFLVRRDSTSAANR